jgi:amino acid transporter
VTTVRPVELAPDAAIARRSRAERSKLRRELGRLDAVCLLIAAIVVLDTLGAVARGGPQTLTWLVVVAALFFVPAGLVIAELGTAFPNQGGPYVWARLAFGRCAGSLVALIYFLETPVWVGGSLAITCVAVVDRLVLPLEGGWRVPVALAFVWTTVALAVAPLRAGKRVPLAGAATQVGLLAFFTATVVAHAVRHGVPAPAVGDLAPSWAVFVLVAPVLVYNFLGFELPSTAGEELRDPARDVPASIVRAGVLTCALYAVPVLAIVLVVPAERLTSLTGFVTALAAFAVAGDDNGRYFSLRGAVAADGSVALSGAGSCSAGPARWCSSGSWRPAARPGSWGPAGPRRRPAWTAPGRGALGRISPRTGVPVVMGLVSGGGVAGRDDGQPVDHPGRRPEVLLGRPDGVHRPDRARLPAHLPGVPGPAAAPARPGATVPGPGRPGRRLADRRPRHRLVRAGHRLPAVARPGHADPDASLPAGFEGQRLQFELLVLAPLAVVVAACTVFHLTSRRST